MSRYFLFFFIMCVGGCDLLRLKEEEERVLVELGDKKLYYRDIASKMPAKISQEDSMRLIRNLTENWIKSQLIVEKALKSPDLNREAVEKKVADYKNALLIHDYEKRYIQKKLQTAVSDTEIRNYYNKYTENFKIGEGVIKCLFFKFKKKTPNLAVFQQKLKNYEQHLAELEQFANAFSVNAFFGKDVWIPLQEVTTEINNNLPEKEPKLTVTKNKNFYVLEINEYKFFLKIVEYKQKGEIAPLDYVEEDIKSIILSKRKILLKKNLLNQIYDEAKNSDVFEIYVD